MQARGERDDEATLDIGRALAIVALVQRLPRDQQDAEVERLCGDDQPLRLQVQQVRAGEAQGRAQAAPGPRTGTFGRYSIQSIVGSGAMGEVYRAVQHEPRRTVALKLLRNDHNSAAVLARFRRESAVLAHLRHPGIVRVFDAGTIETEGHPQPYIAMDFVEGKLLLDAVADQQLGVPQRLQLLIEVCEAIQHAHRRGVIHCDLKPANVMLEEVDGRLYPRVLDFGVALVATSTLLPLDNDRALLGTLAFMSPEQAQGQPEMRSDVYSLGALAYRLLGGRVPIDLGGLRLTEALDQIARTEPVPLGKLVPQLRGDVEAIVARALAKDPGERYESPAELAADLRRHLAHRPVHARRGRPGYRAYAARCWLARNALATATGIVVMSLLLYAFDSKVHASTSDESNRNLITLAASQYDMVQSAPSTPEEQGLLAKYETYVARELTTTPDDPTLLRIEAKLVSVRGNMFRKSGDSARCHEYRERALALLRPLHNRVPYDAELTHDLAIAEVLCGDCHKENGEAGEALEHYKLAHDLFQLLWTFERRSNDDLAWSYLRIADLHFSRAKGQDPDKAAQEVGAGKRALADGRNRVQWLVLHYPELVTTIRLEAAYESHERPLRMHESNDPERALADAKHLLEVYQRLRAIDPSDISSLTRMISMHATYGQLLRDQGQADRAYEVMVSGRAYAADLHRLSDKAVPELLEVAAFYRQYAMVAVDHGHPAESSGMFTLCCKVTAQVTALEHDVFARQMRAADAEFGAPILCELDRIDNPMAELGGYIIACSKAPGATPRERLLEVMFQVQRLPLADLPTLTQLQACLALVGDIDPNVQALTIALLQVRRGDAAAARPELERLARLDRDCGPRHQDAYLARRARRELAR